MPCVKNRQDAVSTGAAFDKPPFSVYNGENFLSGEGTMEQREITCCFTGHRPNKLPWGSRDGDSRCLALKDEIAMRLEGIYQAGYRHFICGMAQGCDSYFAQAVLALRELHPEVTLEAAVPCRDQADGWTPAAQALYRSLLAQCDAVTVLQEHYSPGCMQRRNEYMVDRASLLLACFNGRPGGTMSTVLYATRQGLNLVTIEME